MPQTIIWAKFMTSYDLTKPQWVDGLTPDKIIGVCILTLFFEGGSDCYLHWGIPTYVHMSKICFASFEKYIYIYVYIEMVLVL